MHYTALTHHFKFDRKLQVIKFPLLSCSDISEDGRCLVVFYVVIDQNPRAEDDNFVFGIGAQRLYSRVEICSSP
jgi:hypothetical protein